MTIRDRLFWEEQQKKAKPKKAARAVLERALRKATNQRDRLAAQMRLIISAYSGDEPRHDAPMIKSARETLARIYGKDTR